MLDQQYGMLCHNRNCRNIDSFIVQLETYLFKKAFNLQFYILITIIISVHLLYIFIFLYILSSALEYFNS